MNYLGKPQKFLLQSFIFSKAAKFINRKLTAFGDMRETSGNFDSREKNLLKNTIVLVFIHLRVMRAKPKNFYLGILMYYLHSTQSKFYCLGIQRIQHNPQSNFGHVITDQMQFKGIFADQSSVLLLWWAFFEKGRRRQKSSR